MANPLDKAASDIAGRLPARQGYGFDFTILIDLVISVISSCLENRSAEQVAKAMERMGVVETFMLRRACRNASGELGVDFRELLEACKETAKNATDDERLECCKAVAAQSGLAA